MRGIADTRSPVRPMPWGALLAAAACVTTTDPADVVSALAEPVTKVTDVVTSPTDSMSPDVETATPPAPVAAAASGAAGSWVDDGAAMAVPRRR